MDEKKYTAGKYTYDYPGITLTWNQPQWSIKSQSVINAKLTVGNFCSIAGGCVVWLGGNHRVDRITTYPFGHIHEDVFNKFPGWEHPTTNGDVVIGNDVWIGDSVTIMSGVKIGDGAVVSAHSVVYNNVKPYSVVGGNPAAFWYFRFNEETIKKLLEIKWWDCDESTINEISPILCSGDIDKLFNFFKV